MFVKIIMRKNQEIFSEKQGMCGGEMLQKVKKNRGENGILEMGKASEIKALEFPRGHNIAREVERWK